VSSDEPCEVLFKLQMTESSPILTSGSWHSPYQSDDALEPDVTSYGACYVNVNEVYDDNSRSSDYHEYSVRHERGDSVRVADVKTAVYKRRWYLLLVLSLAVTIQNAVWSTWGPISASAKVCSFIHDKI